MWITALKPENKYSLKIIFWVVAILLGALQAGANRYNISSDDGISYLDIGDAYFRGEWNTAINAQWSPIYSWLLGLALYVFKPSPYMPMTKRWSPKCSSSYEDLFPRSFSVPRWARVFPHCSLGTVEKARSSGPALVLALPGIPPCPS